MSITGISAYQDAVRQFNKVSNGIERQLGQFERPPENSFADTMRTSLDKVNGMQTEKNKMIESFASGETQNVHELMITLQKAGIAVNMTSAVRNKVLEAYKELTRLQF